MNHRINFNLEPSNLDAKVQLKQQYSNCLLNFRRQICLWRTARWTNISFFFSNHCWTSKQLKSFAFKFIAFILRVRSLNKGWSKVQTALAVHTAMAPRPRATSIKTPLYTDSAHVFQENFHSFFYHYQIYFQQNMYESVNFENWPLY